jgi:hypothetical protein
MWCSGYGETVTKLLKDEHAPYNISYQLHSVLERDSEVGSFDIVFTGEAVSAPGTPVTAHQS